MINPDVRIFCVLKQSETYGVDYVQKLKEQLDFYAPNVPFVCLTDAHKVPCERIPMRNAWPGWWSKMELFRPDLRGDIFYLDLDTIVCGNIDDLINVNQLTMLDDFYRPKRAASGIMYLPHQHRELVWNFWVKNTIGYMRMHKVGGDQEFISKCYGNKPSRWQQLFPGKLASYKGNKIAQHGYKEGMSLICFHGKPKPRDVKWDILNLPPLQKQQTELLL